LFFAGLSPFTLDGELRGSRTEYIHWLQDALDRKAIVAQFCRYSAEFKTGKKIKQMVNRALQFATSDSKGPTYLVGAREVMEEEIEPAALSPSAIETIIKHLVEAESPLIIVGYTGRNPATVPDLVQLAESISVVSLPLIAMYLGFQHSADLEPTPKLFMSTWTP